MFIDTQGIPWHAIAGDGQLGARNGCDRTTEIEVGIATARANGDLPRT
jgi:hypothetical protein